VFVAAQKLQTYLDLLSLIAPGLELDTSTGGSTIRLDKLEAGLRPLEAAWLATSSNRQDTLYHDRALVGTLYCDCIFIKYIKLTSKQDHIKPTYTFPF